MSDPAKTSLTRLLGSPTEPKGWHPNDYADFGDLGSLLDTLRAEHDAADVADDLAAAAHAFDLAMDRAFMVLFHAERAGRGDSGPENVAAAVEAWRAARRAERSIATVTRLPAAAGDVEEVTTSDGDTVVMGWEPEFADLPAAEQAVIRERSLAEGRRRMEEIRRNRDRG